MSPALDPLKVGTTLNNRYRVLQPVGRGGMGLVYKAEHKQLQSTVAVKEIQNTRADVDEYRTALQLCEQEARLLVRLNHPNLPRVSDAFIEHNRFYLVMDFVEGTTLERRLLHNKNKPLGVMQVVLWSLQLTDVLHYLHTQNPPIIFRDLKPGNIMVRNDGHLFLIDFGIARRFQPGATKDTSLLGSVGYSPPEQFGTGQTDARADLYAFGATLHNLLTGIDPTTQPFKFAPANLLNQRVPVSLSQLISRCVEMEPSDRPSSVAEVAEALLQIREEIQQNPLYANESLETPLSASGGLGTGNILNQPSGGSGSAEGSGRVGGSREVSPALSSSPPRSHHSINHSTRGAIAFILVVLLVAGITFFAFTSGKNREVTPPTAPKGNAKHTPPLTNPSPLAKGNVVPPPTNRDVDVVLTPEKSATFSKMEPRGVESDPNGIQALHLEVAGEIKNQTGKQGLLVALFFDQTGNPLPTPNRSPENLYMTPEGQVAVAHPLEITLDKQPFEVTLSLPFDQFPVNALSLSYKFRCAIYIEGKRIAETEMKDLALVLVKPEVPTTTNPNGTPPSDKQNPDPTSAGNP